MYSDLSNIQVYILRTCLVLVLTCAMVGDKCTGQSSHQIFEHLTTDDGLSSNKVEAILQDREGFYWISTQNGLNRYDGTSFKVFRHDPGDSTSLTDNNCRILLEGINGDIWVATYKGISRYVKSKGIFQSIYLHHPIQNFETSNRISKISMDAEGNIWIAGYGLWKYNIKTNTSELLSHDKTNPSSISNGGLVTQLAFDKINNGLWLTTNNELNFFSISERRFYHAMHNPLGWTVFENAHLEELALDNNNRLWLHDIMKHELSYFEVEKNLVTLSGKKVDSGLKEIYTDDKNRVWIFYWSKTSEIFDPLTGRTNTSFFLPLHRQSAGSSISSFLYVDQQYNYWLASRKGISIYNDARQYYKFRSIERREAGIATPISITSIAQTDSQSIWLGSNDGLYNYDLVAENSREVNLGSQRTTIPALCADDELLWIGINDQLLCLNTKTETIVKTIQLAPRIFFIRKGNYNDLWVGLWKGGLYRIDLNTDVVAFFGKDNNASNSIRTNSVLSGFAENDNFWIGYNLGQGFSKYSLTAETFVHFHPQQANLSHAIDGTTTVITKDNKDRMWIGTHGSGIFRFNPAAGISENIQQQHGLKSNYINSIIPDEHGNLWVSTADGINYFNTETQSILPLDIDLVFADNDFAANGIYGGNGKIYFFRQHEFIEVNHSAYKPQTGFPKIVISRFKIFDHEVPVDGVPQAIKLTHRENFFSFDFSSIKTDPLKEVKYAYYLEGFDKNWILTTDNPTASYTNVPGGNYTFQVKAKNDADQWSGILLNIPIYIKPPFWRTWWFILLSICFISGIAYSIYWYRLSQLKRIYFIKSKISQDLHDEIGSTLSSINVHSSIASKSLENNMEVTKKALNHINKNSRQVMDNMSDIVWAINSGHPGAGTLENKLKDYGYEFLTPLQINVTYTIDADAEKKLNHIEARKNILLIAKEAMNNIARYSGASEAIVHVEINNKILLLNISDNGKGFNMASKRSGNGLFNMKHRTEALGGKFDFVSEEDGGTSLTCRIPVTNISNI